MEQQVINYTSAVKTNVVARWISSTLNLLSIQKNRNFILMSGSYFKILKKQIELDSLHAKILFPLRGGGKKRKKKNYTKPKKIKHLRKKIKLKFMEYYSVSQDSISRLRKESPECPGCFMANHQDRLTCGKTGITFIRNAV